MFYVGDLPGWHASLTSSTTNCNRINFDSDVVWNLLTYLVTDVLNALTKRCKAVWRAGDWLDRTGELPRTAPISSRHRWNKNGHEGVEPEMKERKEEGMEGWLGRGWFNSISCTFCRAEVVGGLLSSEWESAETKTEIWLLRQSDPLAASPPASALRKL